MLELKGKYNACKVFTDNVDKETIAQLTQLLNQEFTSNEQIRIMPDTHAGKGCVIGTTMTLADKVVPNLVGVDIGCGMLAVKLEETEVDLAMLDDVIHKFVPAGGKIHKHAIATSNAGEIIAAVDLDRAMRSLGTLGGGNHFIELDHDSNNNLWLVIHTGSRHLGIEVCNYYQSLACKKLQAQNADIPEDLCYVEGEDFSNYIHDMKLAQEHAKINRQTIMNIIMDKMNFHAIDSIDTIHNYIDCDNMILRKGAVSSQLFEKLIIPMNMRDGSLICEGKGNKDWNYSAPHGAGRIMSRSQAKNLVTMEEYKESMSGIYTTCVNKATIDESPMVYKPMSEIIDNVKDTVSVLDVIKPIYNFKAN